MFTNLLWLLIVLYNTPKKILKNLVTISLMSTFFVCIVGLKEYFFPTFDYGALSSRAISTFGHPNYLALFLVLFFPILLSKRKYIPLFILSSITLILTKSILGIVLGSIVCIYSVFQKYSIHRARYFSIIIIILSVLIFVLSYYFIPPEKLHSFLSRIYLWETTIRIIFSDWRLFLFGGWPETLNILFNSFKSPYLYIYENFWFTADRPHNFFLNIWYNFWILWVWVVVYSMKVFLQHIHKHGLWKYESMIVIFFVFCFFNYPSIAVYIFLVFIIAKMIKKYATKDIHYFSAPIAIIIFSSISFIGSINSYKLYQAEVFSYGWNYETANTVFPRAEYYYKLWESESAKVFDPLPSQRYYTSKIQNFQDISQNCILLTQNFPSVENYFYCGNIFDRIRQKEFSEEFYKTWLKKLPDLWNKDSPYWNNYFVKHSISWNRFFSKKFSDIEEILEKVWK